MRGKSLISFPFLGLLLLGPGADFGLAEQARPGSVREWALTGGTIRTAPGQEPIRDGVVLIRGARIAAVGPSSSVDIPSGVQTLDCTGKTITAGFWNCHVHFTERKWAEAARIPASELSRQLEEMLTSHGFTDVFDTGSMWENTRQLRARIQSGEVVGPRILSTGPIFFPPGGAPDPLILDVIGAMRVEMPEVAGEEEARSASRQLLGSGVDGIKLYAATWARPIVHLPEEAIRAAVEEAHGRGKPVFAHPSNRSGLLAAVRGGVDILVHTAPQAGAWDETILQAMKNSGVALIPTLKLWDYELRHDRLSARRRFVETGVGQLQSWLAAGGRVLFGTDVGYMSDYDPEQEFVLMAEAGMSADQILASLTTTPAAQFGQSGEKGKVAPGLTADLVVLDEDPALDVRAFGSVRVTIRDGRLIYSASRPEL